MKLTSLVRRSLQLMFIQDPELSEATKIQFELSVVLFSLNLLVNCVRQSLNLSGKIVNFKVTGE